MLRQLAGVCASDGTRSARERGLGHGYPLALQVLAQAVVELRQAAQLEQLHALLLVLAVADIADLVWSRHGVRVCQDGDG